MTDIDVAAVLALAQAARRNDGVAPLSEAFLLDLRSPHPRSTHLTAQIDGELAGYGQVDPAGATELVVHPDHRHAGVARDLWKRALAAGATSLWAHGGLPASAAFASGLGLTAVRELHRMERPLGEADLTEPEFPSGFTHRIFAPGVDDQAWVALNAAAFAGHPEQGRLTLSDLHERMAEPWFDAEGFFLVEDATDAAAGPIAFHWTKVPRDGSGKGEVYVVGVHPAYQGRGLDRPLTRLGTHHLASLGLRTVELYVDGANSSALATYRGEGFTSAAVDVMYAAEPPHE